MGRVWRFRWWYHPHPMEATSIILVALGGGVGAVLRYIVSLWEHPFSASAFPLATILVNVAGCAAIGLMAAVLLGPLSHLREPVRLAIIVGVLGGFTTFSTFALEAIELLDAGRIGQALMYILLSNTLGLLAAWALFRIGTTLLSSD